MEDIKAYLGDDPFIFVSYSHKDKNTVFPFIKALQRRFNVWFDEGIHYGVEWEKDILDHLEKCSLFIYMITDNSLASQNCRDEIYHAREIFKPFINVLCDSRVELPGEFRFRYGRYQMCFLDSFSSHESAIDDMVCKSDLLVSIKKTQDPWSPESRMQREDTRSSMSASEAYELGRQAYDKGDYATAIKYYLFSAENGNASAQTDLGFCYEKGLGVEKNARQAVYWYRKATDQGFSYAQNNLGACYFYGIGVEQNGEQAVYWYRKAADQGNATAQNNLGCCYFDGFGVMQNDEQAVYWFRMAADQGNDFALKNLGVCYEYGNGVKKNLRQAIFWYRKAANQGNAEAQDALRRLNAAW